MDAETYCGEFLEKVFYFCLRKTGNEHDAGELAGEISLEVLAALGRGAKPQSFRAWVWQIARNRWARWAKARYGARTIGLEDADALADDTDVELSAADADEKRRMREALAFIRSEYRTILVAHYFQDKSVSSIARELGLPVGTVKTRLIRSRRELKEGMDMAREFGKRSFAPEEVDFVNNCSHFGGSGQPWTILEHLMYKNIFLEVYNNPETAEELSLELGVALPYMEAELEYLTRETFLKKEKDRYETAFPIISREAQERIAKRYEEIAPELTGLITGSLDAFAAACERMGDPVQGPHMSWEDAKWVMLMREVDVHKWSISKQLQRPNTKRPDGGEWDIIGFEATQAGMPLRVGQHGGYLEEQESLPFVNFSAYRFNFRGIRFRTQDWYDHAEMYALKLVCEGKAEACEQRELDKLVEHGLIRQEGEGYVPCVLVCHEKDNERQMERMSNEERETIIDMTRRASALMRELHDYANQVLAEDMPAAFREDEGLREFIDDLAVDDRGFVLEQAFRDGWLRDDEHTARTVGAWITL